MDNRDSSRFGVLLLVLCFSSFGFSEPTGFCAVSGDAAAPVSNGQNLWTLQSSGKTIVHWDQFSIQAGETFYFSQAGPNAAILNRVMGGNPSQILGALQSNGAVYLLNPNGVFIGPHARVETAGFIASSLDVLDSDFLQGRELLFSGGGLGKVINLGTIECPQGNVALIGRVVENQGTINAPLGKVGLGVGDEVLLQPEGAPGLYILVRAQEDSSRVEEEGSSLLHSGSIEALSIELKSGMSCYAKAVQASGMIQALCVEERGGEVYLVAERGACEVSSKILANNEGGVGGTVHVLGEKVGLLSGAEIDASGAYGGGTILVGGDRRGGNPDIVNAKRTYIGEKAVLNVDALEKGSGGTAIVWADEATLYYGSILMRGGPEGGDGGFSEVSGHYLNFQGFADGNAPMGAAGNILLDPADITISNGLESGGGFTGGGGNAWESTATPANVQISILEGLLATNNVFIDTSSIPAATSITQPSTDGGRITVSDPITWTAQTTLTLIADANIVINATITNTGTGSGNYTSLSLLAKGDYQATGVNYDGIQINSAIATDGNIVLNGRAYGSSTGQIGVNVAASVTSNFGNVTFQHCQGGASSTGNYGVQIGSTVVGSNIIANNDIFGGGGTSANYGFYISSSAVLGSTATKRIAITAGSLGTASTNYGIQVFAGTLTVGDGGTIILNGTGGGSYNVSGSSNYGVLFSNATLNAGTVAGSSLNTITVTGIGGSGTGGSHSGVSIETTAFRVNLNGTNPNNAIQFLNCMGGTGGNSNYGVNFAIGSTIGNGLLQFNNIVGGGAGGSIGNYGVYISNGAVSAPTIIANDVLGGAGTSFNYGFYAAAALGSTATNRIAITAGSLGTSSANYGIYITALTVGDGGTIILNGTGGGSYNVSGSSNYGVRFDNATLNAGTVAGSSLNTITVTGIGGVGTGGAHRGVSIETTAFRVNLNGTNPNNGIQFLNCVGGTGGNSNYGVNFAIGSTIVNGSLQFNNIVGGGAGGSIGNYGVYISNGAVSAPTIIANDVLAGAGMSFNYGFYVAAALGSTATKRIAITAGSLGTSSTNYGIYISGAALTVGDGGTIILNGTGGGSYNVNGSSNYGVLFSNATLNTGTVAGSSLNAITVTGIGGVGTGGAHRGVSIDTTAFQVNLNGTNPNNAIQFLNCAGGTGGDSNYGVNFAAPLTLVNGSLQFNNVVGGGSGTSSSNHGVYISNVAVSAPAIIANDVLGGAGTTGNYGFYVSSAPAVLGSTATNRIAITAGSLGTASSNFGIYVFSGTLTVGDGGTIALNGTGGGVYNGGGINNYGVNLASATLNIGTVAGSSLNRITVTGIGGVGGGTHYGVNVETALSINLNGTNPGNLIQFLNCVGGTGGSTNYGVNFATSLTLVNGSLQFNNVVGGGTGASINNYGVYINNNVTVSAPTIIANDVLGGAGTSSNYGFYVSGTSTVLGSTATNRIAITAGSLGTTSTNYGIHVDTGAALTVGDGGTIILNGTGGGSYNGSSGTNNYGVRFSNARLNVGTVAGSSPNTIRVTGIGGIGTGAFHHGVSIETTAFRVNLNGTNPNNAIQFLNCVGGTGSSSNYGVNFTIGSTLVNGSLQFNNVVGGGTGASTNNYGVFIGAAVSAPNIIATDVMGGPGTINNYGFYVTGATLGSTTTNRISINAGSLGTTAGNSGIVISSSTLTVGDGGTITLNGAGGGLYNAVSVLPTNVGVVLSNATLNVGTVEGSGLNTINVTGVGGVGINTGGGITNHHGVNIVTAFQVNLNGTNPANAIQFLNCVGGVGGNFNYGVNFAIGSTLVNGSLQFNNVVGGGTGASTNNYGVFIGAAVSAPNIIATDVMGGPGTSTNIGFNLTSTLGSTGTNRISITAGSLGTTSGNYGIQVSSGTLTVGDGGTIILNGTGGGTYSFPGATTNKGILLSTGSLTAGDGGTITLTGIGGIGNTSFGLDITTTTFNIGTDAGSGLNILTLTGIGGTGGLAYGAILSNNIFNLKGTNAANKIFFSNCAGGGPGSPGVDINGGSINMVNGSLQFNNIMGGAGSSGNYGVRIINATVSAPAIIATDVIGGAGTSANYGFYVTGASAFLGSTVTNRISITAGSLGTTSTNYGIQVDTGALTVGDGGTIILNGTGGGSYNSRGTSINNNHGVRFSNATLNVGTVAGSELNTINVTGIGGVGINTAGTPNSSHHGVSIETTAFLVNLNGTNPNNSINFLNCVGGTGSDSNYGVNFAIGTTIVNGSLQFNNVVGGGTGTAITNYGVFIGAAVSAPTIIANDVLGGAGTSNNYGFYVSGASTVLGSTATNRIAITAGSLGTTSTNYGIQVDTGALTVGDGGTIILNGTGGGSYNASGSANYGVRFSNATLNAGTVAGSSLNTITVTGIGGVGAGGLHYGVSLETTAFRVNLNGTNPNNAIQFLNCVGGVGGSNNYGMNIAVALSQVNGAFKLNNVTGGGAGTTNNHGVFLNANLSAPAILGADLLGGPGIGTSTTTGNFGLYVAGATLGGAATNQIILSGGSLGTGSYEIGVYVDDNNTSTAGTIQIGDQGTMSIMGTGGGAYNGSGSNNYGVYISSGQSSGGGRISVGSSVGGATATLTGIGGSGSGGAHHGVNFAGRATLTGTGNTFNFSQSVGGSGNGAANLGVLVSSGFSSLPAAATSTLAFKNIAGGTGTSGSHYGVSITNGFSSIPTDHTLTLNFTDILGGSGGNANRAINLATSIQATLGAITLVDVTGGDAGTDNYGLLLASGITLSAPTITGVGVQGGRGTNNNIGLYVNGGTLGTSAVTTAISISAGSFGLGTTEMGILVDNNGVIQVGGTGTITLTGTGGPGTANNYGIYVTGATSKISSANGNITLTGIGGSGTTPYGILLANSGTVTATGSGSLFFSSAEPNPMGLGIATVSTASGNITFYSPITLIASSPTISGAGSGAITFGGTVDGTFPLTVGAATGTVVFQGAVGGVTPISTLAVTASGGITLNANVTTAGAAMTYIGPMSLSDAAILDTTSGVAAGNNISFSSTINSSSSVAQDFTVKGGTGGTITFSGVIGGTNSLDNLWVQSGLIAAMNGGNITANNVLVAIPVSLGSATTVNTSVYPGSITFSSTINGGNVLALNAGSGGGKVTLSGAVGGTTALTSLTATGSVIVQSSTVRTAGNVTYTGSSQVRLGGNITTTTTGNVDVTGATFLTADAVVDTSGANGTIVFNNGIDGNQALALSAGTGTVTLSGSVGFLTPLHSIIASGSAITQSSLVNVNNTTGGFGVHYTAATIDLGGDITSTAASAAVTMTGATSLAGNTTIDTSLGNSAISFTSTITGANALTLTAGSGAINFGGNIGTIGTPLGALSATTTNVSGLTIPGLTIYAASAALNAPVTLTTGATNITASANGNIAFNSTVNGGQALTLTTSGTGYTSFGGNVGGGTPLTSLTVTGATILTGNTDVTTTASIDFGGTIDGSYTLDLAAGTTVTLSGVVGGDSPVDGLTITGTGTTLSNNIYTNNAVLNLSGIPVTLGGNVLLNTASGGNGSSGGAITLGTVNGASTLTLQAGANTITFSGLVGNSIPLAGLTAEDASSIVVNAAIVTEGNIEFSSSDTIDIAQEIHANDAGTISLSHLGDLTITALVKGSGAIVERGGGTVLLGAPVSTDPAPITFNSPITLTADLTDASAISTGAGTSSITFNSTIDGAFALDVVTGTATFNGAVGATTTLTDLEVSATDINIGANQAVSNSITMDGPVTLTNSINFLNTGSGLMSFDSISGNSVGAGQNGYSLAIHSLGGSISVDAINTSGGNGVSFGGNGGSITLQPSARYTTGVLGNIPTGILTLKGGLTSNGGTGGTLAGRGGVIQLAPNGRPVLMSIATIGSTYAGNDVTISCGSFVMGYNEAMTILGSLSITAGSYTVLGDIVALNDLTLVSTGTDTPTNLLAARISSEILDENGILYFSENTHVLSRLPPVVIGSFTPSTFNVGSDAAISYGQLTYPAQSYILNFDNQSTPPPPPNPCPSCPSCPSPSPGMTRGEFIQRMGVAGTELQDLLPLFWRPQVILRIPKILPACCLWDPEYCKENCKDKFLRFPSFNFQNDIH